MEKILSLLANNSANWIIAIATACLVIFAGVQVVILIMSIRESKKARKGQVFVEIIKIMNDLRPEWLKVYTLKSNYKKWGDPDRDGEVADRVGAELERVSFLCLKNITDRKHVKELYPGVFSKCWDVLEKYIKDERISRDEPRIRQHFQDFAQECKRHLADC